MARKKKGKYGDYFQDKCKIADPICTFIFSALVVITTFTVMWTALRVLMEGTPPDVSYSEVKKDLESIQGVRQAHSLHLWSLTTQKAALAVHLAVGQFPAAK